MDSDTAIHLRNQRDDTLMRRISTGESMRSEAIFRAKKMIENKYSLCQTVSKATRVLHISPRGTQETINTAFDRVADGTKFPVAVEAV
jgi:hypothetical protein